VGEAQWVLPAAQLRQTCLTSDLGSPLDDEAALNLWHTACTEEGVYDFDAELLDAEFKHVILAQGCGSREQYPAREWAPQRPRALLSCEVARSC
jgi:hypothetical protein